MVDMFPHCLLAVGGCYGGMFCGHGAFSGCRGLPGVCAMGVRHQCIRLLWVYAFRLHALPTKYYIFDVTVIPSRGAANMPGVKWHAFKSALQGVQIGGVLQPTCLALYGMRSNLRSRTFR